MAALDVALDEATAGWPDPRQGAGAAEDEFVKATKRRPTETRRLSRR